jgi:hypothetical protein
MKKTGTNAPRQNEYRNKRIKGMKETKKNQRRKKKKTAAADRLP